MNRPWMPFWVGDYLADTGHLTTTQHGAYILLILHYWRKGGLPDDDAQLAKITRLPRKAWIETIRPIIEPLFHDGWQHKRVDHELAKQEIIATKRAMAGQKGGMRTAIARINANAPRLSKHVSTEAIAKQLDSKRVAVTVTKISSLSAECEKEEREKETIPVSALEQNLREKGWVTS
jgi:uncharacterized protein YdaU (DUF1376 family)